MATVTARSDVEDIRQGRRSQLSIDSYDRTATLIIALLMTVGTVVGLLAVIFFANKFGDDDTPRPIAVVAREASSPTGNGGVGLDSELPGVPDAPELSEPALQDTLEAVTSPDLLNLAATTDAIVSEQTIRGTAEQVGRGSGLGDRRQPGPGGDGVIERVPRWERWRIRFEPKSEEDFVQWLDQYKVRVGVLGRDNKVHAAWSFSQGAPKVESVDPKEYSAWGQTLPADGPMPKLTRELARRAGILDRGPIALLFYPFEVEELLWPIEQAHNTFKDPNRVRETVFTVTRDSGGFKFEVVSQSYF